MGRGRIPMDLIEKEKARKTTFQKRKNGLMKKVYEFSTLCSVDVGVIIFASKFLDEPEIWPQDPRELKRVIQKYLNTTSDRRPKVYDVEEYFDERMKRIEGEISKVHKGKIQLIYPTWDDSYNTLEEEQLRMFVSILDAKLDACNQRMNMFKRDSKGKVIAESDNDEALVPYLAPTLGNHLSFMQNMSQTQVFPTNDNNQVPFYPCQLSQNSLPSLFQLGQNFTQLIEKNIAVDWNNQVGTSDHRIDTQQEDRTNKNQNPSSCYYDANIQTMQPYNNVALQTLPAQLQCDATFQSLSNRPGPSQGFEPNDVSNMLQPHFLNYMQRRN
ncbi:agamous-like MADS-box protein AGL82 [Vigna umbellata]|uniref:agamous-like MADS-box protein AGL82 n=1 Tax=Vigna umbellata TaxID=87088 RepID=UPI001F5E5BEB|nr:agamous-like MADS-box protein AGL82 [Vigna umbellata]